MAEMEGMRALLFDMVTGARDFLWHVATTNGDPNPEDGALDNFVELASARMLPSFAVKAVLTETLAFLDRSTGERLPSLIDRFMLGCRSGANSRAVFANCVRDVFKFRRIGHPLVQRTIAIIESQYSDCSLTSRSIARTLNVRQSGLDVTFKRETGTTPANYLRETRLSRALAPLAKSTKTIKEIWVQVGYNDPSTFDHHFKRHIRMTPSEYRRRAIPPATPMAETRLARARAAEGAAANGPNSGEVVLVVDDDEGMRITTANYLRRQGYAVHTATNGRQAIEEFKRALPDVILLDLHMPGISGLECLASLRQQKGGTLPSVVILTADWFVDELEDEIHALNATVHSKLCDPETIHKLVATLIDRRSESRAPVDSRCRPDRRPIDQYSERTTND
jgi:CheY-like chemotaxis protein